jgi:hypothetical protein
LSLPWAAYERSAQIFMQGYAQIYNASQGLIQAVQTQSKQKAQKKGDRSDASIA